MRNIFKKIKGMMVLVMAVIAMFSLNIGKVYAAETGVEEPTVIGGIDSWISDYNETENDFDDQQEKLLFVSEEKLEDGNVLVTEIYEEEAESEDIQPFAANKSKTVTKRSYIRTSKGVVLVKMALKASFMYNGKSSICSGASARVERCASPYTITKYYSKKSGNKAYGYFSILKNGKGFLTKVLSLTCSKNGTIS